jgi:predicted GNAT superfamily acetyltransferase
MTETAPVGVRTPAGRPVQVRLAETEADARAAVDVLGEVWRREDGRKPLPPELAWVFAHSGNYVALACIDGEVVGAAIGFRGHDEAGPHLHSHIAGVRPELQCHNVGYVLKQHQRQWSMQQGLDRVTWTFDPLVARNAYFNVAKLGAELTRYYVDFYGPMDDGINDGDETDRCLVTWQLRSPRAEAAAAGELRRVDIATARADGAGTLLSIGEHGEPVRAAVDGPVRLLQVPADIVEVRHEDKALAHDWRLALREALVSAFADGLAVVAVSRDSWYLLAAG